MKFRTRKRLALLVLVLGMPAYIIVAVMIAGAIGPLPKLLELALYIVLGVAWILPLKPLFLGIARPDPDEAAGAGPKDDGAPH